MKLAASNRRALADYTVLETVEAGIALTGTEVKSIRDGGANLKGGYAQIERGEVFLYDCHVSPYEQGNRYNPDPRRKRKLLLRSAEIARLAGKVAERGLTLVPLKLYFSDRGLVKVELGLGRGKREYDKKERIRERESRREVERSVKTGTRTRP
jgi:SsrA-binding protein